MRPAPIPPRPGQESVWDYPVAPRAEVIRKQCEVCFGGETIAVTLTPVRVLERGHPPTYYFPPDAVLPGAVDPIARTTECRYKGVASYFDVVRGDHVARAAAWSYLDPKPGYELIREYIAFYPRPMDVCLVGGDYVRPQPGDYFGGWITADVVGPFKGGPGSEDW